jgi:hypothetical protein
MIPPDVKAIVDTFGIFAAPLAVLYAIHRGWLATRREVMLLEQALVDLRTRSDALEDRMLRANELMRQELEGTRSQLIALLVESKQGAANGDVQ